MTWNRTQEDIDRHELVAQDAEVEAAGYEKWATRFAYGKFAPAALVLLGIGGYAWAEDFDLNTIWQGVEENVLTLSGGTLTALVLGIAGFGTFALGQIQNQNAREGAYQRKRAADYRAGEYW